MVAPRYLDFVREFEKLNRLKAYRIERELQAIGLNGVNLLAPLKTVHATKAAKRPTASLLAKPAMPSEFESERPMRFYPQPELPPDGPPEPPRFGNIAHAANMRRRSEFAEEFKARQALANGHVPQINAFSVLDLGENTCRYAVADDLDTSVPQANAWRREVRVKLFCGAATDPGKPYCAEHMRVCYRVRGL